MFVRFVSLLLCFALPTYFSGCASTEAYLSNPNTEQAIVSLTSAALAYSQGNTLASAVNAVQGATFFIRSIEPTSTATPAPTPVQLGTAAQQAAALSGVSGPVAAAVGAAVTTMSTQGATPTQALESVAGALMVSTGVSDPGVPVQPAQGPRGHFGRIGVAGGRK